MCTDQILLLSISPERSTSQALSHKAGFVFGLKRRHSSKSNFHCVKSVFLYKAMIGDGGEQGETLLTRLKLAPDVSA